MKTRDIAKKYNIDQAEFVRFLYKHTELSRTGSFGSDIPDDDVPGIVEAFKDEQAGGAKLRAELEKQQEEERANRAIRERDRQQALSNMLITSGFNFDGFKIVKYSGYISGDDATQIPRSGVFGGNNGKNLTDALVRIRIQALKELKEAAYDLGCNAVIGVDFDYITLEPETANITGGTLYEPYIICVTANGNAVVIEKE